MPTVYRIIARDNNEVAQYRDHTATAWYFVGRRISAYIVVKSDEQGDRVVTLPIGDEGRGIDINSVKNAMQAA